MEAGIGPKEVNSSSLTLESVPEGELPTGTTCPVSTSNGDHFNPAPMSPQQSESSNDELKISLDGWLSFVSLSANVELCTCYFLL